MFDFLAKLLKLEQVGMLLFKKQASKAELISKLFSVIGFSCALSLFFESFLKIKQIKQINKNGSAIATGNIHQQHLDFFYF